MSQLTKDDNNQHAQCFGFPVTSTTTTLTLTTGSTSVATAALAAGVYRVLASADTHAIAGVAPVAVATDMTLLAGTPEYFSIQAGQKVAGISTTAGATVELTKMP